MNHHRSPGNSRSSLSGIKFYTLGGRRGNEGKQQLVGEAQLETGALQPDRGHREGTNPKGCEFMLVSCGVP